MKDYVLRIVTEDGLVLARFRVTVPARSVTLKGNSKDLRRHILAAARSLPRELARIDVCYPNVSEEYIVLNAFEHNRTEQSLKGRHRMLILEDPLNPSADEDSGIDRSSFKSVFVSPQPDLIPDEGMLQYVAVEKVGDIASLPDRCVAMFSPKSIALLKCVTSNLDVFELNLVVLAGLPGANYSADFDAAVWSLDRAAYPALVSELRVAADIEAQLASAPKTGHEKEKSAYTRANGSVKELNNVVVATADDGIAEEEPFTIGR